MRYLYGDSSEFPLNQNFIETAAAATDMASALLRVDELIVRAKKTAEDANHAAMRELADLDELAKRCDESLADREQLSKATAKVAEEVSQQARAHFERARMGVKAWRDGTIKNAKQGTGPAAIMDPVHRFVVRHELPYTTWGLRWKAGVGDEPVQAQVYSLMQRGLTATVAVAIPARHIWSQPVRVAQLDKGMILHLMGKNWLGRDKMCEEQLDKYFITRVTRTNEREMMVLSKRAKDPSPGIRICLREGDQKRVTAVRVDENDNAMGEMTMVSGTDADTLRKLWTQVKRTIGDLIRHRSQLLAATLNGKSIVELESPGPVAMAIIQAVAPLVRDMSRHSRTPGELQLKRDLGDGRREELFIPHQELTNKFAHLSGRNRKLFDAYGLTGSGATVATEPPASHPVLVAPSSYPAPASQPAMLMAPSSYPPPPASQPAYAQAAHVRPAGFPPVSRPGEIVDAATAPPLPVVMAPQQRAVQQRVARQRAAQVRAVEEEARRLVAVREAADAVRRAAAHGAVIPAPPSRTGPDLLASHTGTSVPPAMISSHAGGPISSIPVPSQAQFVTALSVSAVSLPSPPRLPREARRREHTPSDVVEMAPSSRGGRFRLPPPSAPPPRRASTRPPPPLRVVNG